MQKYKYTGPVFIFGKMVVDRWSAETFAVSIGKARSNIAYQYKQRYNMSGAVTISNESKYWTCI